jgi:hypothetical protein
MSKPSRRPNREAIKAQRKYKKEQQKKLREIQKAQGLNPSSHASHSNATSIYQSIEEEHEGRVTAVTEQARIIRAQLPQLLKRLNKIPDPRNPKKIKYSLTLLMIYGMLMFVFQISSRRQVNKQMTQPQFKANLRLIFPELDDLPHADTLFRLLRDIDVDQIEESLTELIKKLIAKKKFKRYLINNCYPIAIDGTQKMPFNELWCEELLQRKKKKGEKKDQSSKERDKDKSEAETKPYLQEDYQYYVYVLEANLSFQNGMVIPLLSEFLEFEQGDMENNKQDCEQRAFKRLTERLKKYFPSLRIILLLDGLYANGPIMMQCIKKNWQFMIVLKNDSLSSAWEEFNSLLKLLPENHAQMNWGIRHQKYHWVNGIEYYFDTNACQKISINIVTCHEEWQEVNNEGEIITKQSHHAWISSRPLNRNNLHERCNLGARYRWGIEAGILVEKHQGYSYEHCFALDWQAMRGYHYLMRLAHAFNTLVRFSSVLSKFFKQLGVRGFFTFVYNTFTGRWLNPEEVEARLSRPFQLRFK